MRPGMFRFNYLGGHPRLGEVPAYGRTVGTLTRTALELEQKFVNELRPFADGADDDLLAEAIGLALNFSTNRAFSVVPELNIAREKSITLTQNGIAIIGIADLVGDGFVLDYKTDGEIDPDRHRFQLWAYAEALKKPKAYIAYLRRGILHEFGQ